MYQALYRKYRPSVFDDVCGQDHITSVLKYETMTQKVSHAYLFCGSRGTGKTTCAKILAKALNCTQPENGNPCGVCESCRAIDAGYATDVLEMDAASNNGVEYIRDIRDEVAYTPAMLKKKVYIIDEVHMLSQSAFNALLKTLEEPPAHVVFILATTELHKLPATIVSRCQRFEFRRLSVQMISDRLRMIADQENISIVQDALELLAKLAQGGMRDAISLFELCCGIHQDTVTMEMVTEVLGVSGYETLCRVAQAIADKNYEEIFKEVHQIVTSSKDIAVFWQDLCALYRDMMVVKTAPHPQSYLELTESEFALLGAVAEQFSMETLLYHSRLLDETMYTMQKSQQTRRLCAEMTLIRMCDEKLNTSTEALSARVAWLEDQVQLLSTGEGQLKKPIHSEKKHQSALKSEKTEKKTTSATKAEPTLPLHCWSDVVERLSEIDKGIQSFLLESVAFISEEKDAVLICVNNPFGVSILKQEKSLQSLFTALRLCGCVLESPQAISIVYREEKVSSVPAAIDELADEIE